MSDYKISQYGQVFQDDQIKDVFNIIKNYDTLVIGSPVYWGVAAWPVDTFVSNNDFTGKTVIPFCTSASSSLSSSGESLAELAGTGNWLDGHRFTSNPQDSDIDAWTDSLR